MAARGTAVANHSFDYKGQQFACEVPRKDLQQTKQVLRENQEQIDKIIATVTSGQVATALLEILNEKAAKLKLERKRLRLEHHRLSEELKSLNTEFEAESLRSILTDVVRLAQEATPEELQRLLRLIVRRIEWLPDGTRWIEFYNLGNTSRHSTQVLRLGDVSNWLEINVRYGCPLRWSLEPMQRWLSTLLSQVVSPLSWSSATPLTAPH